jgi:signal transduction histidine kinase
MIRHRLSWALVFLAITIVLQALVGAVALRQAEQQVLRGRIASDIHRSFVELSATKQRLHTWMAQRTLGGGGEAAERDRLMNQMGETLTRLQTLTQAAQDSALAAQSPQEQLQRQQSLDKLAESVGVLRAAVYQAQPNPSYAASQSAWDAMSQLFEFAGGYDLRQLIAQSIARESAAMLRERDAADAALAKIRFMGLGVAGVLALLALAATVYFGRALRRPVDALAQGAQMLAQGRLEHRIVLTGKDEFSTVANSMNGMAEQLEAHQLRDAAERNELEELVKARTEDLHQANESLLQTDARRRQLLADISHELRTPTTVILGEAEVTLRNRSLQNDDYRESLQRIVQTSRQLGSVIDDLLAMARTDVQSWRLVREPLELALPLQEAIVQAGTLAATNGVRLVFEPSTWTPARVLGDHLRLVQLFLVLLDNAIRYSHEAGSVEITVDHWRDDQDGQSYWRVRVIDHGIGISQEELPKVFDRHFRGAAARQHRASGSGLGLSIALALAQAHGGSLKLDGAVGRGTQAVLLLPASISPVQHA